MAYTTINKSTDYFNTKLYTGNNSTNAQTGVGFQPDLVWLKNRGAIGDHLVADAVRGADNNIRPNTTSAESDDGAIHLNSFDSDGFTVGGTGSHSNANGNTYVSWNWLGANGTASNTDGTVTSTVSANTTSGFSIVKWTGTGNAEYIGHGLGANADVVIIKNLGSASLNAWYVNHKSVSSTKTLYLNTTDAETTSAIYLNTAPNNLKFRFDSDQAVDHIAYCFAEKQGYSKFGSYVGNGSADGTFVYTGFKPAMTIHKNITTSATYWRIFDNKRSSSGANVIDRRLFPQTNEAEDSTVAIDYYSNGFKMRGTSSAENASGATYIYMAFASAPLVGSNNVPCTAR